MFKTNPVYRGRKLDIANKNKEAQQACLKLTPFIGDGNIGSMFNFEYFIISLKLTPFIGDGNLFFASYHCDTMP